MFFLLVCCLPPLSAFALEQAGLSDIVLIDSDSDLLIYFQVTNAFTPEMEEGIKNGIPVCFTFYLELQKTADGWPDRDIANISFDRTLTYDNLKEEYQVELGESGRRAAVGTLAEARRLMVEVHDYQLAALKDLDFAATYKVRIKARLAKKTLPLNFQYVIPFWSLWEFETDWYGAEFVFGQTNQQNQANQ